MKKIIAAVFKDYDDAEKASSSIADYGFNLENMSIIKKDKDETKEDDETNGAVQGGVIGGTLGLLLGVGAIMIPGLGILAAAGPLAGILSGAVAGGVIGALVDLGIPEEAGKEYEGDIKNGKVLWSMSVNEKQPTEKILKILRESGAIRVNIH
ncbi:MAG: hypothetical protein LBJ09_02960 [Clostridiales bacterium]|jgi:uncharacterized membrane protein|nr:hypothetical protein [Clostridiales bacterium]